MSVYFAATIDASHSCGSKVVLIKEFIIRNQLRHLLVTNFFFFSVLCGRQMDQIAKQVKAHNLIIKAKLNVSFT